jgi:hypothetical protein
VTDDIAGACALGLGQAMVVVSRELADALPDDQLDQIVMHEHAHLARYDDWSRLLQAILEAVVGLHPAVWLIGRQIELEREAACDDRVADQTGAACSYAACLAEAAAIVIGWPRARRQFNVVPLIARSAPALRRRVERLLDVRRNRRPRAARVSFAGCLAALAVVVFASSQLAPLVVFVEARGLTTARAIVTAVTMSAIVPAITVTNPGTASVNAKASHPPSTRSTPAPDPPHEVQLNVPALQTIPGSPVPDPVGDGGGRPPLPSAALLVTAGAGLPDLPKNVPTIRPGASQPWTRFGAVGVHVGNAASQAAIAVAIGATKTGTSISRFFSRSSKGVASTF